MEFGFESLRRHENTDERIDVATSVRFDDTAELMFAASCIESVIQFLECEEVSIDPESVEVLLDSYRKVTGRLASLVETGTAINQDLLPRGVVSQNRFGAEGQEIASAVYHCVETVKNIPGVRAYFPEDQVDLLTIFASAE